MCVNKREIVNKYTSQSVYVDCGKCPECDYDKSQRYRSMLSSVDFSKYDVAFVTCTYDNRYMPYISKSDLLTASAGDWLEVFRLNSVRYLPVKRHGRKLLFSRVSTPETTHLSSFQVHQSFDERYLPGNDVRKYINGTYSYDPLYSEYIPVCSVKDIQDFIKRTRFYFNQHEKSTIFRYFYVAELGETTFRPHFHVLFFVPKGTFTRLLRSARKAWPYGTNGRRFCERAISPQKYLSSYVLSRSELPMLYQVLKSISPKVHHSNFFDVPDNNADNLRQLLLGFKKGSFEYSKQFVVGSSVLSRDVHLSPRIVSYYFPRFKGFNRFTSDEVFTL